MSAFVVFLLNIFLEAGCEVRVVAVPADVGAGVVVAFFASFGSLGADGEVVDEKDFVVAQFPDAAAAVFGSGSPEVVAVAPFDLDYLFAVGADWEQAGQCELFSRFVQVDCKQELSHVD